MLIIYGASTSGEIAYKYLSQKGVQINGFIDKNYKSAKVIDSNILPVYCSYDSMPSDMKEECKRILIAVGAIEVAQQIKQELSYLAGSDIEIITIYDTDFEGGLIGRLNSPSKAEEVIKLCLNTLNIDSFVAKDKNNITMRRYLNENLSIFMNIAHHGFSYELVNYIIEELSGKVAIDIGANRGYITTALARKFEQVYSFEPSLENYKNLIETVVLNNQNNVTFEKYACTSYDGEADFFEYATHSHHSLGDTKLAKPERVVRVQTTTLDTYCEGANIKKIDLLKIDVEGYELDVLMGASKLIDNHKIKKIIFEYNPIIAHKLNKNVNEALIYLLSKDYAIYNLKGERLGQQFVEENVVDLLAISK